MTPHDPRGRRTTRGPHAAHRQRAAHGRPAAHGQPAVAGSAHAATHGPGDSPQAALTEELATLLAQIVPPGGAFRHREHIHLAYLAVQRHGADRAADMVSGWIRQLAAYQRAPQKFNATVTRAWTEIVAHHMAAAAPDAGFASFADSHPALLGKRLLTRHYTARALASPAARTGWVEPDLVAFPWHGAEGP